MSKTTRLLIVGLILTLIVGLLTLFAPSLVLGFGAISTRWVIVAIALGVIVILVGASREAKMRDKPKRTTESYSTDRYAMLEQMVEELSTKERHYLQRLLDERSARHVQTLQDLVTHDGELREAQPKGG